MDLELFPQIREGRIFKLKLPDMKIIRHFCPFSTDEFFQITPGPDESTLNINRVMGEDYFIELFDKNGKIIISCNYPVTMHTRTFDLGNYGDNEFMLRISRLDGIGIGLYRIDREA